MTNNPPATSDSQKYQYSISKNNAVIEMTTTYIAMTRSDLTNLFD